MRKRSRAAAATDEDEGECARTYSSTAISVDSRRTLGCLFAASQRLKYGPGEFLALIEEAGYHPPTSTLYGWSKEGSGHGAAFAAEERRGRKKKLSALLQRVLAGFVLVSNYENRPVHLSTVLTFVKEEFEISMVDSTALEYLEELGFASRLLQTRKEGYVIMPQHLACLVIDWLAARRTEGMFALDPSKIWSFDYTYTSNRTYRKRGFAAKGGYTI